MGRVKTFAALLLLASCGGSGAGGRDVRLVSASREVDRAIPEADAAAVEGDLDRAESLLRAVVAGHRGDALAWLATLKLARLRIARDDLIGAGNFVDEVPAGFDVALDMRRGVVQGLLYARQNATILGVPLLRRLDGRMIDRQENVEVACSLGVLEAADLAGELPRALRALATVERAVADGVRWPRTGLPCDDATTRLGALRATVARVNDPQALADTLDTLPDDHPARGDIARRLRAAAEQRHEMTRWLPWLADLRDDESTLLPVTNGDELDPVRIGVLAPTTGALSNMGVEAVRAVSLAVSGHNAVEVFVESEGDTPDEAMAALDRLRGRNPDAVIGPSREDLARAVMTHAIANQVTLYLPVPPVDAPTSNARVHVAGPSPADRAVALAAAVARRRGSRVVLAASTATGWMTFADRVRAVIGMASVPLAAGGGRPDDVRLAVGLFDHEARERLAAQSTRAPSRWIFDARSAAPLSPGVWVGVRPGPDLAAFHARFCAVGGRAPGELAMLFHDAARAVLEDARNIRPERALSPSFELATTAVEPGPRGSDAIAATRPCAPTPPPDPRTDPYAGEGSAARPGGT